MQITLRSPAYAGPSSIAQPIPLEPFAVNKEMGRILIRRNGETVAAGESILPVNWGVALNCVVGVVLEIVSN